RRSPCAPASHERSFPRAGALVLPLRGGPLPAESRVSDRTEKDRERALSAVGGQGHPVEWRRYRNVCPLRSRGLERAFGGRALATVPSSERLPAGSIRRSSIPWNTLRHRSRRRDLQGHSATSRPWQPAWSRESHWTRGRKRQALPRLQTGRGAVCPPAVD